MLSQESKPCHIQVPNPAQEPAGFHQVILLDQDTHQASMSSQGSISPLPLREGPQCVHFHRYHEPNIGLGQEEGDKR